MKKVSICLVLVLAMAFSSSCAFGAAFKIGGTGPLTGGAAIYGNAAKNGAEIAVEEINAMNGDIKFEIRYEDDTHDAEKAVNAYNALKDWGMQISLGSVTSKPCEATAAENFADRIFALTPSAYSAAVTEGKDNVFQMCFVDPNQGSASAQYIAEKGLAKKVAIIWKNDDVYSKGIRDTFVEKAPSLGLE
ncbi:MAG: ABC transporter substrate-binding protein, partial [Synergistaceae bacterium]|nr:ABC transporter substrate-binding protein [Synergistaceae bacterium]